MPLPSFPDRAWTSFPNAKSRTIFPASSGHLTQLNVIFRCISALCRACYTDSYSENKNQTDFKRLPVTIVPPKLPIPFVWCRRYVAVPCGMYIRYVCIYPIVGDNFDFCHRDHDVVRHYTDTPYPQYPDPAGNGPSILVHRVSHHPFCRHGNGP